MTVTQLMQQLLGALMEHGDISVRVESEDDCPELCASGVVVYCDDDEVYAEIVTEAKE